MTDNRTTELLCKLLKERGVDYTIDDSIKGDLITVLIELKRRVYIEVWSGGGMAIWGGAITPEQAIAATLGSEREAKLVKAISDVLRHATDTVWVGEAETLADRMVSLGVYGHEVYEGVRPWEVGE